MERLKEWNRSNPEKQPYKFPVCYGSAEWCQECDSCMLYIDCFNATQQNVVFSQEDNHDN